MIRAVNLEISCDVPNRDRLMSFISTCVCLELERRMLRFLLLSFVLLEATAGLAVARAQEAKIAEPLRAEALRQRAEQEAKIVERMRAEVVRKHMELIELQLNAARQPPAEQFYRMIFQQDRTPDAARERLETLLSNEVAEIDFKCTLSPAQKRKLLLMGRGDIKRFFDRCETLKEKFLAFGQNDGEINEDLNSLQIILRSEFFHADSLLHKSLHGALTGEQFAVYDALIRDRVQSHHAAAINQLVTLLEQGQGSPFSEAERQKFVALLKKETRPPRITSPYDFYYILGQLGRLPEEKVKPLLNEAQWFRLHQYEDAVRRIEPGLLKAGHFRGEDDEDEKPGAPEPAPKK
jgi:hypothetical protein